MPQTLLTLAIETSNPSAAEPVACAAGVALGTVAGGKVQRLLGVEPIGAAGRGHDDDLMPAIDRLCRRCGAAPRDLRRIAVSVGPGGYTGLRVACATGKMIAEGAGASCVAVPSAMVVAHTLVRDRAKGELAVALASKGESAWVWVEGDDARAGKLATASNLAALHARGVRILAADRFLPEPMLVQAGQLGLEIVRPVFDPAACLAVSAALADVDGAELVPIYPREPDAVTLWRARTTAAKREGPE